MVTTWLKSTEAHENQKILELMDENAIFLAAGQPALQGRKTFTLALDTMQDFNVETASNILEIKVSGDLAYCWNHLSVTLKAKQGRNIVKRTGNVLSILEKKAGKWVITRDANMLSLIE